MANINDIESLFSLIGQSPNDYKEFYHEKNGLHALDKSSYLKNIQLENPNEEGISIFEDGPINPSPKDTSVSAPLAKETNLGLNASTSGTPNLPTQPPLQAMEVVVPAPKIERYTSPVLESKDPLDDVSGSQSATFSDADVEPLTTAVLETPEPLIPQVYNPASAPQAPKVYSTTSIPSVPSFIPNFASPMNASTSATFTSSFVKPTVPTNSNLQSTFTPARVEPPVIPAIFNQPETKPNTQTAASPLNSIFSRLEQK
jgi:hypothetical protein